MKWYHHQKKRAKVFFYLFSQLGVEGHDGDREFCFLSSYIIKSPVKDERGKRKNCISSYRYSILFREVATSCKVIIIIIIMNFGGYVDGRRSDSGDGSGCAAGSRNQNSSCCSSSSILAPSPILLSPPNHNHDHNNNNSSSNVSSANPSVMSPYSYSYFGLCLVGGACSSSVRWMLTPIDLVKVNLQAHPGLWPNGVKQGLATIYNQEGLRGLYRGLTPTILAYATQSGVKYATYEYLKRTLWTEQQQQQQTVKGYQHQQPLPFYKSQTAVYMLSAAIAEAIADILMCPWEMLKVKIQTAPTSATSLPTATPPPSQSSTFPTRFGPAFWTMYQQRHSMNWPFGAIMPLWGRQIIGTVANFVTFEHVANVIYDHLLTSSSSSSLSLDSESDLSTPTQQRKTKSDLSLMTQLAVTFTAGYISGFVSTIVSHPADTIVSLQARYPELTTREIIERVGLRTLATKGLGLRIVKTGTIIASQWLIYDSFKSAFGMGTTGGGGGGGYSGSGT